MKRLYKILGIDRNASENEFLFIITNKQKRSNEREREREREFSSRKNRVQTEYFISVF